MLFNSGAFLLFFPIVVLLYFVVPKKFQMYWLLIASYYFYLAWNPKYGLLLLFVTATSYLAGMLQSKYNRKLMVGVSITLILLVLFVFKYLLFAENLLTSALHLIHVDVTMRVFDIVLPVGISFYSFQAIGYVIDVYRGKITVEKNFFKYALFVSFFPQLVAGPIERSENLLKQLDTKKKFDFDHARDGFLLMLWGYFLKIVLADRIAIFVDDVYANPETYQGWFLIVATMLFAVQIYCDFYGYSTIAVGAAKILGIKLMDNFDAPYLATSVAGFWRRWHISLTSWFKDYVYIPLGGSRRGRARRYLNIMIVFLLSGLWHGANLSFVVWGGLNGLYQIIGDLLMPIRKKLAGILQLNTEVWSHKFAQAIGTFILVDFSWIFFRANGIRDAIVIIKNMFAVNNIWVLLDDEIYTALDRRNWYLMVICIVILLIADIFKLKKISLRAELIKQNYLFRAVFVSMAIVAILTYGIWGSAYNATSFIYFQF